MKKPGLPKAIISWRDNVPESRQYDDIYFSKDDGFQESMHVFVTGNNLINRFKQLAPAAHFSIAETGFGCGLNFLLAWHIWQIYAPRGATLNFISVEKSPLSKDDLVHSHQLWPVLSGKAQQLQNHYPEPVCGLHCCIFPLANIRLSLFYGEAVDWLEACSFKANAWFLDGFSPRKNPDLWTPEIFRGIRHHSLPATTFATYSAARSIREGLSKQGFSTEKIPGFGAKRDMTRGSLTPMPASGSGKVTNNNYRSVGKPGILVVGSGLAGAFTARSLANRGYRVYVLEAGNQVAAGASGNQQGALYIKLAVNWSPHTRYHLASYLFALRAYAQLEAEANGLWYPTGVLQLAQTPGERLRQQKFLLNTDYPATIVYPVNREAAQQISGVSVAAEGLFFPGGGWCRPASICKALLSHPLISIKTATTVVAHQLNDKSQMLITTAQGAEYSASHIVYCTGNTPHLSSQQPGFTDAIPVKRIRGQITQASLPEHQEFPLKTVICGEGYAMPAFNYGGCRQILTGASFHPRRSDASVEAEDNNENFNRLRALSADFKRLTESLEKHAEVTGRASVRAALPDYFPAIGQLQPGIYSNLGFGSKGLALAPLAGEIIADLIGGHCPPIEADLLSRLSPGRFNKGSPDRQST